MKPQRTDKTPTAVATRHGATLIVAMICLLLVSMLSAVLVRTALAQREQLERDAWQLQAEWLAQSGLERALAKLDMDAAYTGETWRPAGEDSAVIGRVEILVAAATEGSGGRVLKLTVDVPDDPVNRAHIGREINLPEVDSSINEPPADVSE